MQTGLDKTTILLSLLLVVSLVHLFYYMKTRKSSTVEMFESKRDKANAIQRWITTGKTDYLTYRNATARESNIVEYSDVLRLLKNNTTVSIDDIESVIY